MMTLLTDLVTMLREEVELYRRMLTLVRRERGRIVKGELAGLVELVQQKEVLSQELERVHFSRSSLLNRLAASLGDEGSALTLARVVQIAPSEMRPGLSALVQDFRSIIGQLVAANDVNRTLLDRSLECVRGSLELFRSISGSSTYGAAGRLAAPPVAVLSQTA
jgi:flagellar biosynthesis/type III secretory pathway chaperone